MDEFATVTITRGATYQDRLRAYRILVDGQEVAKISAKQSVKFSVPEGPHTIVAKIDWCSCEPVTFTASGGGALIFECGSGLTGWRIFLAFYYVLFARTKYLWLRQVA